MIPSSLPARFAHRHRCLALRPAPARSAQQQPSAAAVALGQEVIEIKGATRHVRSG